MDRFHPFSVLHGITVMVLVLAVGALSWGGRVARRRERLGTYERTVGIVILAYWVVYNLYATVRFGFSWSWSLPLQVCDITAQAAVGEEGQRRRLPQTISYFWGIALSTQGVITPDLLGGLATIDYWGFWSYHLFVVGAGVYALAVRGYRPTWRDYGVAASVGVAYAVAMFALDALTGANYGYLGRPGSSQPSLLDLMGPWPGRVPVIVGLALAGMAVLQMPWTLRALRRHTPRAAREM
jgi:hypothetical integral membrane protein (TIGR02206 family)